MQCFVTGEMFVRQGQPVTAGVVSFSIPDMDITFRAQFKGTAQECQFASLLALLEFVDLNPQMFKNKTLELFSDSTLVVRQINDADISTSKELEPYRAMALSYRRKYPYNLCHIRRGNNPAVQDFPPPNA